MCRLAVRSRPRGSMLTAWDGSIGSSGASALPSSTSSSCLSHRSLTISLISEAFACTYSASLMGGSCSSVNCGATREKGKPDFAPPSATMIADQTRPWLTNFHEILTNKAGKLEDQGTFLSPSCTFHSYVTADGAEYS